jgi:hypothetical protein
MLTANRKFAIAECVWCVSGRWGQCLVSYGQGPGENVEKECSQLAKDVGMYPKYARLSQLKERTSPSLSLVVIVGLQRA